MESVSKILDKVKKDGFKGVTPLYLDKVGAWHDAYALFYLEFSSGEPDISEKFTQFLERKFKDCEVNVRGTEFEIIGWDFDEVDDYYYDYFLIDEIW